MSVQGYDVMTPLAAMLLSQGGWPLSAEEAAQVIFRWFIGKCGTPPEKKRLMAKLGVEGDKFPVSLANEHAAVHASAALAELMLLGFAEARQVGPGRVYTSDAGEATRGKRLTYSRTALGAKMMAGLHGKVAMMVRRGGWG